MVNKFFSGLWNYILFTPALLVVGSLIVSLVLCLLCSNHRLTWITPDLLEWVCAPATIGAWFLSPIVFIFCIVCLFRKNNNRRLILIAITVNILALAFCFFSFILPSLSFGKLIDNGANRIEFYEQSEGIDLDSNFLLIAEDDHVDWDGGWLVYYCGYVDTAMMYKWIEHSGLTQKEFNINNEINKYHQPSFSRVEAALPSKDISQWELFEKHVTKNLGNSVLKYITISALLDKVSKRIYIRIERY